MNQPHADRRDHSGQSLTGRRAPAAHPGRTAASAAAGGVTAAVAFAAAGRPGMVVALGFMGAVAAAVAAVVSSPAGEALARGHAARRLLQAAAEESRRTDTARLQGAVALLLAVDPDGSPSARLPLTDGDTPPETLPTALPGAPEPPAPEGLPP